MASDRGSRRIAALAVVAVLALWHGHADAGAGGGGTGASGGGTGATTPGSGATPGSATAPTASNTWVIEPTAEETGAVAAGTAEIERAQQLARSKQYVDAVRVLEAL